MSEYLFGSGRGWLPKKADRIAQKHDACLVNHTDPQCTCGYGCLPFECKASRRHWFATRNYGSPHDQRTANAVLEDLRKAGILPQVKAEEGK